MFLIILANSFVREAVIFCYETYYAPHMVDIGIYHIGSIFMSTFLDWYKKQKQVFFASINSLLLQRRFPIVASGNSLLLQTVNRLDFTVII